MQAMHGLGLHITRRICDRLEELVIFFVNEK